MIRHFLSDSLVPKLSSSAGLEEREKTGEKAYEEKVATTEFVSN
jgi:hypothetical protein